MFTSAATFSCAALRARNSAGASAPGGRSAGGAGGPPRGAGRQALAEMAFGSLSVRKWQLANGLTVITVPDPGARAVSYVTVFRVGSRDENGPGGETGLAHLFEHLMFTGAADAAGGADFDQQIEEVGGSSNAMTYYDFTTYTDELPPEALDRAIALEARRMTGLELAQKQVANERDVVVQERLGSVDDSVDGTLEELLWQQAFPDHPYGWPIIGRMADIKGVTRQKALAFYRRHYTPDRAVVVVAGRFDESAALTAIQTAYGDLPRGAEESAALPATPAPPTASTSATGTSPATARPSASTAAPGRTRIERPLASDRLAIGFAAPALDDPRRPAYELIDELLTGGPSSRLYRALVVDRELASSISSEVAPTRDPGLWAVWTQLTRGNQAARAEELVLQQVARLSRQTVGATELAAAKNRLETSFWDELSSSRGRAEAFGQFEVTTGDFRNLLARSAAYEQVTAQDIQDVARKFLTPGPRSVVVAVPEAHR